MRPVNGAILGLLLAPLALICGVDLRETEEDRVEARKRDERQRLETERLRLAAIEHHAKEEREHAELLAEVERRGGWKAVDEQNTRRYEANKARVAAEAAARRPVAPTRPPAVDYPSSFVEEHLDVDDIPF